MMSKLSMPEMRKRALPLTKSSSPAFSKQERTSQRPTFSLEQRPSTLFLGGQQPLELRLGRIEYLKVLPLIKIISIRLLSADQPSDSECLVAGV